jgi:hypothetical protein
MIKFSKIIQFFASTTILKPPIPLKKTPIPINAMSTNNIAQKLNISESALRKQMINPKNNVLSK